MLPTASTAARFPVLLALAASVLAGPSLDANQKILDVNNGVLTSKEPRKLTGRFLHITDFHPDQFYRFHTDIDESCHSGKGKSGKFGAETTDCDSPIALVNATLDWVRDNIRDQVDFVIWTGDNARHDNDENFPRNSEQVLGTNRLVADKMFETFATEGGEALEVPVVPTFGNNDFLPHNIMLPGPNRWFIEYADIWGPFIPEEQRHQFEYGGWFYTEVIPHKLVVFSLNTMFFFDRNAAVDGCALVSEPGYKHMEWLRVQLQRLRDSGMKAILMGHVPPARTDSKQNWDETCWQRYTLWLKQYRDVVIGGLYGHMNVDHFVLQDTKDIDEEKLLDAEAAATRESFDISGGATVSAKSGYLKDVREQWSKLPAAAGHARDDEGTDDVADDDDDYDDDDNDDGDESDNKDDDASTLGKKKKKRKRLRKIGGKYAERYQVSVIGPSVIPNYFPTMRVYEYNISGIEDSPVWKHVHGSASTIRGAQHQRALAHGFESQELRRRAHDSFNMTEAELDAEMAELLEDYGGSDAHADGKKKKKGRKGEKGKLPPWLVIPDGPGSSTPPGPAYMAQTLSWTAFTQYYANLTRINHEYDEDGDEHKILPVTFEVEYDTRDDDWYQLKDLTVRELLKLAHNIGVGGDHGADSDSVAAAQDNDVEESDEEEDGDGSILGKKKKKGGKGKKKKGKKDKKNKLWIEFLRRAFVGTIDDEDLEKM